MLYIRQHRLLEELYLLQQGYSNLFPSKNGRKLTIKWTKNDKSGKTNPYLYSWEYFKADVPGRFNVEKGEFIDNIKYKMRDHSQSVYICPLNQKNEAKVLEYFTNLNLDIIERIEYFRDRLNKQIEIFTHAIEEDEIQGKYKYDELDDADQLTVERNVQELLENKFPLLFNENRNEETIDKLTEEVKKDLKKRDIARLYIKDQEMKKQMKLENTRIKKELLKKQREEKKEQKKKDKENQKKTKI